MLDDRTNFKCPVEQLKVFIDNTNLQKTRGNCFGSLVAYTANRFNRHNNDRLAVKSEWRLCILLHHHPKKTLLLPCNYSVKDSYQLLFDDVFEVSIKDPFQLRYINRVSDGLMALDDSCIDSNINGPDVLLRTTKGFPDHLIDYIKHLRVILRPPYIISPHQYQKKTRGKSNDTYAHMPDSCINLYRENYKNRYKTTSERKCRTIKVNRRRRKRLIKDYKNSYLFPLLTNAKKNTRQFAVVNEVRAKTLIKMKAIYHGRYDLLVRSSASKIITLMTSDVPSNGVRVEVVDSMDPFYHVEIETDDERTEAFQTEGLIHGVWGYSNSLSVTDWKSLVEMILHAYGDYGFQRSSTECIGLNTYAGFKAAKYVRPSPKMSKSASNSSQYYRKTFDSTYMPLVYKLINELSKNAGDWQCYSDRIFDRFQHACWKILHSRSSSDNKHHESGQDDDTENEVGRQPQSHPIQNKKKRSNQDESGKHLKQRKKRRSNKEEHHNNKRFASLSILTGGNSQISGFTNQPHDDVHDLWSDAFIDIAMELLEELIELSYRDEAVPSFRDAVNHIQRLSSSSFAKSFSSYTTCGYHLIFDVDNEDDKKENLCYFVYLDLGVAIKIPANKTVYHMFGGAMTQHLTAVPITFDGSFVRFYDPNMYVLAWGNGKSLTRVYIEEQTGRELEGRITQQDIRDFFDHATQQQRDEITRLGALRNYPANHGDGQGAARGEGAARGAADGEGPAGGAVDGQGGARGAADGEGIAEAGLQQNQNGEGDEEDDAIVREGDEEDESEERQDDEEESNGEVGDMLGASVGDGSESELEDESRARAESPPRNRNNNNNDSEEEKINDPDYDADSPGSPVEPEYDPSTESFQDWKKKMGIYAKLSKEHHDRITQRYRARLEAKRRSRAAAKVLDLTDGEEKEDTRKYQGESPTKCYISTLNYKPVEMYEHKSEEIYVKFKKGQKVGLNMSNMNMEKDGITKNGGGIYITRDAEEGTAAKDIIFEGHIITAINSMPVRDTNEVISCIQEINKSNTDCDEFIRLKVHRQLGRDFPESIKISHSHPRSNISASKESSIVTQPQVPAGSDKLFADRSDVNVQNVRAFDIDHGLQLSDIVDRDNYCMGLRVDGVAENSNFNGQVVEGDYITYLNGNRIKNIHDLRTNIRMCDTDTRVKLVIKRHKSSLRRSNRNRNRNK